MSRVTGEKSPAGVTSATVGAGEVVVVEAVVVDVPVASGGGAECPHAAAESVHMTTPAAWSRTR
jgi:hypothetical protein